MRPTHSSANKSVTIKTVFPYYRFMGNTERTITTRMEVVKKVYVVFM